jgi:hypothetical protein
MDDSTSAAGIPADATMVAGYVDGLWPSYAAIVERFPGAVHVGIAVNPADNAGDVLDVENGDATPAQVPAWWAMRSQAGVPRPCAYVNRSNLGAVDQALVDARIPVWAAVLWVATLDRTVASGTSPHGYPIVACQTWDYGGYDESVVFDDNWPAAAPLPSYPPTPLQGGGMRYAILITTDAGGNGWDNQFQQRAIAWSNWDGTLVLNGTDPDVNADDRYPSGGTVRAQQRNGLTLVEVVGATPNGVELVWIGTK